MKKYYVYGLGNALVDMEFAIDEAFIKDNGLEKGRMTLVDSQQQMALIENLSASQHKRACGGSAANTVLAVAYFGASAYYSCKVANDALGDFYLQDLRDAGVDSNISDEREDGFTGTCLVMVTPDAERTMNTYLGISSDLTHGELDFDAILQSQCVYAEGYLVTSDKSRAAVIEMYEYARKNNIKTVMTFSDPSMVQYFSEGILQMLGTGVDLLFCNEEEALLFAQTDNLDIAINELKKYAKTFAITTGAKGSIVFDGEAIHKVDGFPVKPKDTNGAGDIFAGAFLYSLTTSEDLVLAARFANWAASRLVSYFGPRLPADDYQALKKEFADL